MPKKPTSAEPIGIEFDYQPKQKAALRLVERNGGQYVELAARHVLEVGGQRSGKTLSKLMHGVQDYCLKFRKCNILVLRRTFPELDAGAIQDFKTFVPRDLYDWNATTRVATLINGSQVTFAGCANNVERDIEKYLGQAYPYILVDECAQFSPEVWQRLSMRNLINAGCEPDEHGNFPTPAIVGCTNPIGSFWEYYHTLFVKKKPWDMEDGMRQARDGSWWAPRAGEYECVYDPRHYYYNHSTVLDNPLYLKRDPTIVERLRAMPPDMRDRFLYGVMDKGVGQYFDCWSPEHHVVDLRTDPEAIIWEDWQPVWGGQDYGVGHWNAIYLFTKAKVRSVINDNYKTKTVCFVEIAPEQTGQTGQELVNMLDAKAYYPRLPVNHPQYERISGKRCKISALYFSHEKFSRVMERHSPADEYSRLLRQKGLPSVSRATMDRIGSASFMYNELKLGNLVVLATCQGIIQAIPALMRDPDHLDDVLKAATKADDRYDAFRYGLFGGLAARGRPQNERDQEYAESITDPMARYFYLRKRAFAAQAMKQEFKQEDQPVWYDKV